MTIGALPTDIRAGVEQLRRLLAERGQINDADAASCAAMMETMFAIIESNTDQDFQRRMLDAARNEWHQLTILLDVVPALKARTRRRVGASSGGAKAAIKKKRRAARWQTKIEARVKRYIDA